MNRYPRWKLALFIVVLAVAGLYALPNLFPDAPAVQISRAEAGDKVSQSTIKELRTALQEEDLAPGKGERVDNSWLVRFENTQDQLRARALAQEVLGEDYVVAPNLVPTTPEWLQAIGARPVNLGLDLRGGVHFLLQVDMDTAIEQRLDAWSDEIKRLFKEEGLRYRDVKNRERGLDLIFGDSGAVDEARNLIRDRFDEFALDPLEDKPGLSLDLRDSAIKEIQDYAVDQNRTSLNNRVNELGVAQPVVQRQGADRIVVQLPGVQDAARARRILGRTATLEFRLVADENDPRRARTGVAPPGTQIFPYKEGQRPPVILEQSKIVTGDRVVDAQMGFDQNGQPQVNINLDGTGARSMRRVTSENVGEPMSVLFIETKTEMKVVEGEDGEPRQEMVTKQDKYVINVATIQDTLSSRFRITGLDNSAEASELALLLRAGGLAAPVSIIEERTVGPSLGADNIEAGLNSIALGLVLVLAFMAAWYRVFGLVADIAVLGNLVIVLGVMSLIPGATLTLPGIAGMVLTVGMAVDANVLIFERIRQELKAGEKPLQAIDAGYGHAFVTILDANVTTLIVAVILFAAGTGSVQGFAVTLFIGILTSMFTAILGTRAVVELIYGRAGRAPDQLSI
jgi:preprotein translocase subunit SecD